MNLFRFKYRKQNQQDEEDNIYSDETKATGKSSEYYKDLKNDTENASNNKQEKPNFSSRLRAVYQHINKTLKLSNQVLNEVDNNIGKQIDTEPTNDQIKVKSFDVNEFNPEKSDMHEKDIPIDSLKLFQKQVNTKKSNIELEQQRNIRNENPYVSFPTKDESNLNIFEVKFSNELATLKKEEKKLNLNKQENTPDDTNTEIYQSIKELDTDKEEDELEDYKGLINRNDYDSVARNNDQNNDKKTKEDEHASIYSTPTNIRLPNQTPPSSVSKSLNSSKAFLLNESTNETDA